MHAYAYAHKYAYVRVYILTCNTNTGTRAHTNRQTGTCTIATAIVLATTANKTRGSSANAVCTVDPTRANSSLVQYCTCLQHLMHVDGNQLQQTHSLSHNTRNHKRSRTPLSIVLDNEAGPRHSSSLGRAHKRPCR